MTPPNPQKKARATLAAALVKLAGCCCCCCCCSARGPAENSSSCVRVILPTGSEREDESREKKGRKEGYEKGAAEPWMDRQRQKVVDWSLEDGNRGWKDKT